MNKDPTEDKSKKRKERPTRKVVGSWKGRKKTGRKLEDLIPEAAVIPRLPVASNTANCITDGEEKQSRRVEIRKNERREEIIKKEQ